MLPLITIDQVFHVGSLVISDRTTQSSLEANCLSVSVNPEEWGNIARVAGTCWTMTRPGALWIDACNLDDAQEAALLVWAVSEGLLEPATLWRAWHHDGESDDWRFMSFGNEAAARHEIGGDVDDDGPSDDGTMLDSRESHRLTVTAMAALKRWSDPFDAINGAVILYAERVLGPTNHDVMGIWWDEIYDPLSLSCPRGGVLSDKITAFSIAPGEPGDEFLLRL